MDMNNNKLLDSQKWTRAFFKILNSSVVKSGFPQFFRNLIHLKVIYEMLVMFVHHGCDSYLEIRCFSFFLRYMKRSKKNFEVTKKGSFFVFVCFFAEKKFFLCPKCLTVCSISVEIIDSIFFQQKKYFGILVFMWILEKVNVCLHSAKAVLKREVSQRFYFSVCHYNFKLDPIRYDKNSVTQKQNQLCSKSRLQRFGLHTNAPTYQITSEFADAFVGIKFVRSKLNLNQICRRRGA